MVILELIHAESPNFAEGMYLLDPKPMRGATPGPLGILDNCSNRMASCRRWCIQISALSTFDGRGSGLPWLLKGKGWFEKCGSAYLGVSDV